MLQKNYFHINSKPPISYLEGKGFKSLPIIEKPFRNHKAYNKKVKSTRKKNRNLG